QIGDGGSTGAFDGFIRVRSGASLVFNRSGSLIHTNPIDGAGTVVKNGAGTVTLTAANTYTGATTVNAGKLALQNNLTSSSPTAVTGGKVELASGGGSNRVIKTPAVSISGTGKIDLQDNKLIVTTAGQTGSWTGSTYTGVTGMIKSGKGSSNTWNGAS